MAILFSCVFHNMETSSHPYMGPSQVWGLHAYMVYGDTANTAPMKMLARWHLASCLTYAS